MRLLLVLMVVARASAFNARPSIASTHLTRLMRPPVRLMADRKKEEAMKEVWQFREEFARGSFRSIVDWKEEGREAQEKRMERRKEGETANGDATKSAFAASAAAVIVGALVLRLGGRAALVGVLGLDVVADLGIGDSIDQVLAYADQAGGWTVAVFIGAWVVAKVFLIDIVAIALAFSSGLLFGGVLEGALVSAVGATLGSLTAFGLSRSALQERVDGFISKRPVARGLAKVVEEDGFKTVFVLRLSPILPIPTGAYPYIYGTSKLNPLTFAAGYFLGSLKPYLLDSYLGVFSKQIIDGSSLDDDKDILLLVGLGALVLVGVFATELANESWDLVQQEVKKDKQQAAADEAAGIVAEDADEEGWDGMLGPLNTTKVSASVVGAVPEAARDELSEVWEVCSDFCDAQWAPAVAQSVRARERARGACARGGEICMCSPRRVPSHRAGAHARAREGASGARRRPARADEAGRQGVSRDPPRAARDHAPLTEITPLTEGACYSPLHARDVGGAHSTPPPVPCACAAQVPREIVEALGEKAKLDETPTAADLAKRAELARWTLDADGPWRELSASLAFGFALLGSARKQWVGYPETVEELAEVAASAATSAKTTGPVIVGLDRKAAANTYGEAAVAAAEAAAAPPPPPPPPAPPARSRQEIEEERAAILRRKAEIEQKLDEVAAAEDALK